MYSYVGMTIHDDKPVCLFECRNSIEEHWIQDHITQVGYTHITFEAGSGIITRLLDRLTVHKLTDLKELP